MIGHTLAWAIAIALIVVGLAAWLAPRATASGFGVAAPDTAALAYVRATGSRDFVLALILIVQIAEGVRVVLAWSLALAALVAAADLAVVIGTPGGRRSAGWIHGSGIVVLLVAAACVATGR
jgi:hypothetical protein